MVVFDMAGTVVNEDNLVYKTLHKAIVTSGIEVELAEILRLGAGKAKLQAVADILATHGPDRISKAGSIHQNFLSLLTTAYQVAPVSAFEPAAHLFSLLKEKGIHRVLNTGYDRSTALSLLKKMNWREGQEYDWLITASDVVNGRPAPDMIHEAMKLADVQTAEFVGKIGDSIIDIEEGRQAGCGWVAGITTGAHRRDQLESTMPDLIVDSLDELTRLFPAS